MDQGPFPKDRLGGLAQTSEFFRMTVIGIGHLPSIVGLRICNILRLHTKVFAPPAQKLTGVIAYHPNSTMSSMIKTPSEIEVSKIEISAIKALDNGGKTANIRYEGRNIMIEAPSLPVPYGVNVYDKTPGAAPKFSVDLSLRGADENDEVRAFKDFFETFDEFMIDAGVANASKWFKMSNPNREVIRAFYTPTLKISKDANGIPKPYPPTVKISLRKKKDDTFETSFYNGAESDESGNLTEFAKDTPIDQILCKRSQTTAIIQCTGVWFAGGKFGTTWKAVQLRVDSQPEQIRGPAFRSEAPDIRAFVSKNIGASAKSNQIADEFDGAEEEDGGDVVAAFTPAKKVTPVATATPTFNENVVEPIAAPKKTITTVKKVVKKVGA